MEFDDDLVLLFGEVASLEVWPEIVYPSKTAALATTKQAYIYIYIK